MRIGKQKCLNGSGCSEIEIRRWEMGVVGYWEG